MTHERADEGAAIVELIEYGIGCRGQELPPVSAPPSHLRGRRYTPLREILLTLVYLYRVHAGRLLADGVTGLLLQRDFLHLCADTHRILQHSFWSGGMVHSSLPRPVTFAGRWRWAGRLIRSVAGR